MKTLITGAGSSIDIDCNSFYDGNRLLNEVYNLVNADIEFRKQILIYFKDTLNDSATSDLLIMFCDDLDKFRNIKEPECKKQIRTIDEFLGDIMIYPEYLFPDKDNLIAIGKYAIFYAVMKMEKSYLESEKGNVNENWILQYKKEFHSNPDNKIITFNYDRLIEYLLNENCQSRILHVYGTVSLQHWKFGKIPKGIGNGVDEIKYEHLGDFKIVNDRVREPKSSAIIGIERIAQSLQRLNFVMGFGFDFYNVRNLGLLNNSNRVVYANLHPNKEDTKETGFKQRRLETDKVRRMVPDAFFTYHCCFQFINMINNTQ